VVLKIHRSLKILGISAAGVLASFALATPAQAASVTIFTSDDNPGGSLSFTANGDVVELCDRQADGKRAVGNVYNPSGSRRYTFYASGHGTCNTRGASDGGVFDLVEGQRYGFEVCLEDDSNLTDRFCRISWVYNNN
jgi:hypothetical protein